MDCPHCSSNNTRHLDKKTNLGYQKYYCRDCCKQYNERTGTKLNFIEFMTEVVMLVVYHYYRFKLSLDDVVELMALRGFSLSHQTVHNWVQTFGVKLGRKCREKRKRKVGKKWHVDSTYWPYVTEAATSRHKTTFNTVLPLVTKILNYFY